MTYPVDPLSNPDSYKGSTDNLAAEKLLFDKVSLHSGNCLHVMSEMLKDNSIDSCVTDPPYHLKSIVKRFGKEGSAPAQEGTDGRFNRLSRGFMNREWDGGDIAFRPETWAEVYRVLKPGAYLVAFGGTRSYHRMACAIEDAGFEIRDSLMWLYGTGFPKSHDVSKGIDKQAGAVREVLERVKAPVGFDTEQQGGGGWSAGEIAVTAPATDAAREWEGWGTALKPGFEPIVLARKPLAEKTVAANVLQWRTGAINIDECRIHSDDAKGYEYTIKRTAPGAVQNKTGEYKQEGVMFTGMTKDGRWPANVVHDGSAEVVEMFPESKGQLANARSDGAPKSGNIYGKMKHRNNEGGDEFSLLPGQRRGDEGSAARFFYSAKASKAERAGSKHPTVKPIALMQWLVRLITPPGGTVIDPFAGTGTVGEAAWRECFRAVLCEAEPEYQEDIRRRMSMAAMGPEERARYEIKMRSESQEPEMFPLSEAA